MSKKKWNVTISLGRLVGRISLAILIVVLYSLASFLFMERVEGLPESAKAAIGERNIYKYAAGFSLVTILLALYSFIKKKLRLTSVLIIGIWILGMILLGLLLYSDATKNNVGPTSDNFIRNRDSCDKQTTLENVKKCTVLIERDDGGHGTGFVVNKGFVITNKHVIENSKTLKSYVSRFGNDSTEVELQVWNYSPNIDLAVLKLPFDYQDVATCSWFDSTQLELAEELYAIGWPNEPNGESTVTKGIYSRVNKYEDGTEFIQTDAPINPGNSGGPLVNQCGIVGVNSVKFSMLDDQTPVEGYSLALSSNYIHKTIDELQRNGSYAKESPDAQNVTKINPNNNGGNGTNSTTNRLDLNSLRSYLSRLYGLKSSWEGARGKVNGEKLDKLIDSYNRQIDFTNHLINKLSNGGPASNDDVNLWNSVVNMSYESSAITRELNSY